MSTDRGFARKKLVWDASGWLKEKVITLDSEHLLKSQIFTIQRQSIDTQWKFQLSTRSDSEKLNVVVDLFMVQTVKENFMVHVESSALFSDGSLVRLEKFSKEASRLFKDGDCVLKMRDDFLSSTSLSVHLTSLQFEIQLIEDEKVQPRVLQSQNENYEKLLNNEELSDFSFVCSDGEKIHVNKCIIAIQCPTFSAMLQAEMEESQTAEADIEDIDSETMLELLRFMYCGRVKDIEKIDDKLLGAANKNCIDELRQLAVSSIIGHIDIDNVVPLLEISELYGQDHLTDCCVDFIKCKYDHIKRSEMWLNLSIEYVRSILDSSINFPATLAVSHTKVKAAVV